jgi:hypothetical protein
MFLKSFKGYIKRYVFKYLDVGENSLAYSGTDQSQA